jgi:sulfur carrier protein
MIEQELIKTKLALLKINGQKYKFRQPLSISELITYLGFNKQIIVVDYNKTVLPKEYWITTSIKNNDAIEILTIAGGG